MIVLILQTQPFLTKEMEQFQNVLLHQYEASVFNINSNTDWVNMETVISYLKNIKAVVCLISEEILADDVTTLSLKGGIAKVIQTCISQRNICEKELQHKLEIPPILIVISDHLKPIQHRDITKSNMMEWIYSSMFLSQGQFDSLTTRFDLQKRFTQKQFESLRQRLHSGDGLAREVFISQLIKFDCQNGLIQDRPKSSTQTADSQTGLTQDRSELSSHCLQASNSHTSLAQDRSELSTHHLDSLITSTQDQSQSSTQISDHQVDSTPDRSQLLTQISDHQTHPDQNRIISYVDELPCQNRLTVDQYDSLLQSFHRFYNRDWSDLESLDDDKSLSDNTANK